MNIQIRTFTFSIAATAVVFVSNFAARAADDRPPNVVIFLADDQGWGDLSASGNRNLQTPNIDALARDGASFDRFYVCPVCSPTRAEFLTGRYHPRGGVYSTSTGGERLDLDEMTIAETFRAAGYVTGAFGKWHNGMQYPYHPNGRGFDEYYGFCSGHWGHYFSPMLEHNGQIVTGEGFCIDDFTNRAMKFIETNKDRPFFAYLPYNTPHSPMQVPERWWDALKDKEIAMRHRDGGGADGHARAALAMCENIDWNVGRLLKQLDELGIADNTIVLYFSDNGPNGVRWNGDMRGRKGSTDEGGVRSPLLVRWPGKIKPKTKVTDISAAIDLLPTLAELCGIEVASKKPLDGMSVAKLLLQPDAKRPPTDRLIFSHWSGRVSVRSQQYRLDDKGKLYDMTADPGQRKDVAKDHPDIAEKLRTAVGDWRRDVLAELKRENQPFTVGDDDYRYTQLPARDAQGEGKLQRSNRHPNCTYFENWKTTDDRIVWDVDVRASGDYEVEMYYTCPAADVGSTVELRFGETRITAKITEANDPPLVGAKEDRVKRGEGYVKDFRPMKLGAIHLEKGKGELVLRATEIPGKSVGEFRLLMLTRVKNDWTRE